MSEAPFRIERLGSHDRTTFDCGIEPLTRYFQKQVSQDVRRRVAACFVAIEQSSGRIAGYYTLSAAEVRLVDLAEEVVAKLPRYPAVPVALIGRLAVGTAFKGRKLGSALLYDAGVRAAQSEIAVFAIAVDAKDDAAEAFYLRHGFRPLASTPKRLFAPISVFAQTQR